MKKQLLLTFLVVFTLQFNGHAQLIDQWTFTTDPVENSDIKNKAINTWDPDQTGNSWAGGVLTWGYDHSSASATSGGAFLGDTWLGVTGGTLSKLELIIDAKDINFSQSGGYGWQFTPGSANVRSRIAFFGNGVSMRMQGTGSEWNAGNIYLQNDYTSITDLQLTFIWDFANNTMSVAANGSGILAADGSVGTIDFSNSTAQDLSGVTNLTAFRTYQQGQGASYMELDRVSILANGATLSTPNTVLDNAKVWYSNSANALHIDGVTAQSVRVYALSGAKVAQYDNPGNTITLGDLSSGLYIASVLSEHGTKTFKFVKKQ